MPQDGQHVYFLSADRRRLVGVITDLTMPNGIIGTPDGRSLFVSDIEANQTCTSLYGVRMRVRGANAAK